MKINYLATDKEERFKSIKEMAGAMQIKGMTKNEMRHYAESIELMADTKWIKAMNCAIEDVKRGLYVTLEELK